MKLERKLKHLEREIKYYSRVYPKSDKIPTYKSMYRHYKKIKMQFCK